MLVGINLTNTVRIWNFMDSALQVPMRTASTRAVSRTALREGTCFKAVRLACNRQLSHVKVSAGEIQMVEGDTDYGGVASPPTGRRHQNKPKAGKSRFTDPLTEKRIIVAASSFVVPAPAAHLTTRQTDQISMRIIDVQEAHLMPAEFPAMAFKDGVGYCETNVAEVLLGLDPSIDNLWLTPAAFQHVRNIRKDVCEAGGVFLAEFEISTKGDARFQSIYVCPAPSNNIDYVHVCRTRQSRWRWWGDEVYSPLISDGGKIFSREFSPSVTRVDERHA